MSSKSVRYTNKSRGSRFTAQQPRPRPRLAKRTPLSESHEKDRSGLNDKQKRFAEEYTVDLNLTQAAKRAGYSKKTAYSMGSELLKKPEVKQYVEKQQAKLSQKTEITAERVLQEIAKLAFADIPLKDLRPGDKLGALRDHGTHLNLFKQSVEVDTRMSILNLNVTAEDLAQARALVESTMRGNAPVAIEGKVEPGEGEKS